MIRTTIGLGIVLIVLGAGAYGYALTGEQASITALIPAFFGLPILGLGLAAARWPARRAVFMHVAALLAVLGFAGAARGLGSVVALITRPDEVARPVAVIVQSVMALLCMAYVILAVRSFILARRDTR
jgi:hypothetical protein